MRITPAQCRAARGLLAITQSRLAELSEVSTRAINSFEGGTTKPVPSSLMALKMAFERAGVVFLDNDGVRLRRDDDDER
jgi:predicted transcriptional regulator